MKEHHYIKLLKHLRVDPKKIPLCIETGTHRGWGTEAWASFFDKVFTIELSEGLFQFCLDTYDLSNVEFLCGSSPKILNELLPDINKPYFLFLDAHGSGGDTTHDESIGRFGSPAISEIQAAKNNPPKLIVIDDLSDFEKMPEYPDPEIIKKEVAKIGDYHSFIYSCDVMVKGALVFKLNE